MSRLMDIISSNLHAADVASKAKDSAKMVGSTVKSVVSSTSEQIQFSKDVKEAERNAQAVISDYFGKASRETLKLMTGFILREDSALQTKGFLSYLSGEDAQPEDEMLQEIYSGILVPLFDQIKEVPYFDLYWNRKMVESNVEKLTELIRKVVVIRNYEALSNAYGKAQTAATLLDKIGMDEFYQEDVKGYFAWSQTGTVDKWREYLNQYEKNTMPAVIAWKLRNVRKCATDFNPAVAGPFMMNIADDDHENRLCNVWRSGDFLLIMEEKDPVIESLEDLDHVEDLILKQYPLIAIERVVMEGEYSTTDTKITDTRETVMYTNSLTMHFSKDAFAKFEKLLPEKIVKEED